MDEEQVDEVDAQLRQRGVEGAARVVGAVCCVAELAGDVDLVAARPGDADGLADATLVLVHLGRVDVPIAGLERQRTASAVSSGGTWYVPKPSCGMVWPSLSVRFGMVVMLGPLRFSPAVAPGLRTSIAMAVATVPPRDRGTLSRLSGIAP